MSRRIALPTMVALLLAGATGAAATDPAAPLPEWSIASSAPATREVTLDDFMQEVLAANLDYAAQRYNVDMAKADAAAAKLWPNPALDASANRDLRFHGKYAPDAAGDPVPQTMPESREIGLTQTIESAGKRRWRIRAAEQTYHAAAATLDDFLRNLKLDATAAFAEALATRETAGQQRQAAQYLARLVEAQRLRHEKGDLSEADYLQSRLDELQLQNDLRQAEAAATAAQFALSSFLGRASGQTTLVPRGRLDPPARDYDLTSLVARALTTRADLVALRHTRDAAQSGVQGARAQRAPDVAVGVSLTHNAASQNFVAPAPQFNQLALSLSLPLPLWDRNQHGITKAQAGADQAQRQLEAAELRAEVDVRTAYAGYTAAVARVAQFQGELLHGADTVLAARRYSYERGQTSLLELLDAQRTANDVQQSYHDALADAVKAHLDLLRAAGLDEPGF